MTVTEAHLDTAARIAREFGAKRLVLFGSGLHTPQEAHDFDLAVEGVPGWDLFRLAARLEEALHVPLDLARNDLNDTEFAGACFSPNGQTLFVNVMGPTRGTPTERAGQGMTIAIWGPWAKGAV